MNGAESAPRHCAANPGGPLRLGIFGGTFDPIHLGHLAIAEEARSRLGLSRVVFVPAGAPPHKADRFVTPAADRLNMVRLAIADNPGFTVDDLEMRRDGPSFTADTLEALAALEPGAELFYLLGSDSVVELDTWRDPPRLFARATFVGLVRPGWPPERIAEWLARQPPAQRPRVVTLDVPGLDIASRDIRRRVALGGSIRYLVPEGVRDWILTRRLYTGAGAEPPGGATGAGRP